MSSPTARSMQFCKKHSWHAQVVEKWNQWARRRIDLFGCIDLIVLAGDKCIGVQATSGDHHSNRREKALAEPRLRAWLAAGCLFEVWSWSKKGARGKRKLWELRREPIELKLLHVAVPQPTKVIVDPQLDFLKQTEAA